MTFRVGVSGDLFNARGEAIFGDEHLAILNDARHLLAWEILPAGLRAITPEHTGGYDALWINTPRVDAASFAPGAPRVRIVARHGVGYDSVDVPALSERGIVLTNTPVAVRRPVATAALTLILALSHRLMTKDRLTREGRWAERGEHMGVGLTGRTLGIVGAGSIGRDLAAVVKPLGMTILAADPYADAGALATEGIALTGLDDLFARADFVVVACLLTEETRHLVGARAIGRMKPTAYLINVARGPIVDEAALIAALRDGRIAGAGLDVFEQEPVDPANPLLAMDNTIVTPHALCWTDECFGAIACSAMTSIVDALSGRVPAHVVNPDALAVRSPG